VVIFTTNSLSPVKETLIRSEKWANRPQNRLEALKKTEMLGHEFYCSLLETEKLRFRPAPEEIWRQILDCLFAYFSVNLRKMKGLKNCIQYARLIWVSC
jgi:hypothetical protein